MKRIVKGGYVLVNMPEHSRAYDVNGRNNESDHYVKEHILVAEEILDRPLREGEVTHHLDLNKTNNSPDNLLVLSGPMHIKLHNWLNKHTITPNEYQEARNERGCVRCVICEKPVSSDSVHCSPECHAIGTKINSKKFDGSANNKKCNYPDRETLEQLIWSKPTTVVAEELGVSDKAIEKLCRKLDVDKPPRGYWTKVKAGLICPLS